MADVTVERVASAAEFLARTAAFRATEPLLANLLGSIATSVVAGRSYDEEFWWVVVDGDRVVGCGLRTAPHRMIVPPMPAEAAAALGRAVRAADPDLPGCNGPGAAVAQVLAAFDPNAGFRVSMNELVYELGEYVRPRRVAGASRAAAPADLELLVAWHLQFGLDAGLPMHDVEASVASRLGQGGLWLWEVDGRPVSMAGHATLEEDAPFVVGRVGPVFTPAELRGRGYGSAVTATVVDALLPRCDAVMLFTDASNATSNGIYRALGFREVGTLVETELASTSSALTREQ